MHFSAGRRGIPMMVLTFTDGQNNAGSSIEAVRNAIGRWSFFPRNNCFFAIAGVGDADEDALRAICKDGYGLYKHSDDMEEIFALFLQVVMLIAMQVGARVTRAQLEGARAEKVEAFARVFQAVFPLDYTLNLDRSGSMGPRNGGGCYISTAVTEGLGLSDGCLVLQKLRCFRDEIIIRKMGQQALVDDYYSRAPRILQAITAQLNPQTWYRDIYHRWLVPCVGKIDAGQFASAVQLYSAMVISLEKALGTRQF